MTACAKIWITRKAACKSCTNSFCATVGDDPVWICVRILYVVVLWCLRALGIQSTELANRQACLGLPSSAHCLRGTLLCLVSFLLLSFIYWHQIAKFQDILHLTRFAEANAPPPHVGACS